MSPSADNVVLKESSKSEPRTKSRKNRRLWNATFKEIAAFKRVVPSDLGLQRAAARERAKDSTNAFVIPKASTDQLAAARIRVGEWEHYRPKDGNDQRGGAAMKRAKYSTREYFVPKDGIDREVITQDICRYLGNDAIVRPATYEVSIPPTFEIAIMLTSSSRTLRRDKFSEVTLSQLIAILPQ